MNKINSKRHSWLLWVARGFGTLVSVFWVFSLGAHAFLDDPGELTGEGMLLGSLVLVCVTGLILAWYKEKPGGIVTIIGGLALSVFAYISAGRNEWLAVLVSGAPFLLAGVLFFTYSQKITEQTPGA